MGPVLQAPDLGKPFSQATDIGNNVIGAVLLQDYQNEELHPVKRK